MTKEPNLNSRPGRMLAALLGSDNSKGKMELTVQLIPNDGKAPLHRAFTIKKWKSQDGTKERLYVQLPDTADWAAGIRPLSPIHVDLTTGEIIENKYDERNTPLLIFAAKVALNYARTGECATRANGTSKVVEALRCGRCGTKLKDPKSIERGIGPECFGKATGSKAIPVGQTSLTEMAAAIAGKAAA